MTGSIFPPKWDIVYLFIYYRPQIKDVIMEATLCSTVMVMNLFGPAGVCYSLQLLPTLLAVAMMLMPPWLIRVTGSAATFKKKKQMLFFKI